MKTLKFLKVSATAMFVMFAVAGCADFGKPKYLYQAPAIVDISESKVVVQLAHIVGCLWRNSAGLVQVKAEANRGCSRFNRKASIISSRCVRLHSAGYDCEVTNYLFACQEQ